jgi:hypothetical protein
VPTSDTPTLSDGPPAADRTDYRACADAHCEVAVAGPAQVPLGGTGGVSGIRITSVNLTPPNPSLIYDEFDTDGSIAHDGWLIMGQTYGDLGYAPGVRLELLRVTGHSVVLRISSP